MKITNLESTLPDKADLSTNFHTLPVQQVPPAPRTIVDLTTRSAHQGHRFDQGKHALPGSQRQLLR